MPRAVLGPMAAPHKATVTATATTYRIAIHARGKRGKPRLVTVIVVKRKPR